jgi:hypothetical protein
MPKVIVVVRELGRLKPDYSLPFDLPEVPKVGSYISISRPDAPEPYSEDLIVRQVWWRLHHPETAATTSGEPKAGRLTEIMVECDPAIGPYALDRWRDMLERARGRGVEVEEFEITRFSVRQDEVGLK